MTIRSSLRNPASTGNESLRTQPGRPMLKYYDRPITGTGLTLRDDSQPISDRTVWIDLVNPTVEEDKALEAALGISIPTRAEMREIESSSRLYSENGTSYMTAFIVYDIEAAIPKSSTVTFILAGQRVVTVRYAEPKAFPMYLARADKGISPCYSGASVMMGLIETLISRKADLIERIQDEVEALTHQLFDIKGGQQSRNRRLDVVLKATGKQGDKVASAQEAAMSMERLLNYFQQTLRQHNGDDQVLSRIEAARHDIASLNDHMRFLSDRTSFLLSATLGMITTEQNQIIKLFSVMAVILMPPTLVASIYGMNFRHMPELGWELGYPTAIGLMFLSALIPFVYFKRKGWL